MRILFITLISFALIKCTPSEDDSKILGTDVRLFKGSPVWKIAQAIEDDDTLNLNELIKKTSKSDLNYKEKRFGQTLLIWSVYSDHYAGFRILLNSGVDYEAKCNDSTTALSYAAAYHNNSDYLRWLIKKGANVNHVANCHQSINEITPLIAAASTSLTNTRLLVEAGVDVNYIYSDSGWSASPLHSAFIGGKMEIIKYLIINAGVDVSRPLDINQFSGDSLYLFGYLRKLVFPIGSKEHKMKMEVVEFLKMKGLDYWSSPIPEAFYKDYDSLYLKQY